jgi:hypothetical protein
LAYDQQSRSMLLDGAADEGDERLQPSRFKRAVTADVIDAVRDSGLVEERHSFQIGMMPNAF